MKSVPGEDAVKIAEVPAEDSEYDVDLGGAAAAGSARTDPSAERGSTVGEALPSGAPARSRSGREESVRGAHFPAVSNCRSHLSLQRPPP